MNSKRQSKLFFIISTYTDERGIVLIAALALVAILALVGGIAVITTNTDVKISINYKSSVQALYAAQAGIEEARDRLRGPSSAANYAGDPAANPNENWSAYILTSNTWQTSDDPKHNTSFTNYIPQYDPLNHTNTSIVANSLQTGVPYWVKIRHKREFDAEQAGHTTTSTHYYDTDGSMGTHTVSTPGNIVYYGYGDPLALTTAVQFTSSAPPAKYKPVEIITAYGSSGGSLKVIEIEVVHYPGPPVLAPLYSNGAVKVSGSGTFIGADTCSMSSLPPIYTKSPYTVNDSGSSHTYGGNPSTPQSGSLDIDIAGYINAMKDNATITITDDQTGTNYGDTSNYVICYANMAELKLTGGTGFGILLVDGDLELAGGFTWNGLILVTGRIKMNGGGSNAINISGAVFSGTDSETTTTGGSVTLTYDSCAIENSLINQPLKVIKWKEIY